MPKYKPYNYSQTALVAIDLEKQLPAGSLEFAIHYLVDNEIDLENAAENRAHHLFHAGVAEIQPDIAGPDGASLGIIGHPARRRAVNLIDARGRLFLRAGNDRAGKINRTGARL